MSNTNSGGLSERELEILKLVATGASNKEIAQQLYISTNTVKVHLRNIFNKINATSRTEAAMYAVQIGLVQPASQDQASRDSQPIAVSIGREKTASSILGIPRLIPTILGIALIISLIGISIVLVRGSEPTPSATQEQISPTPTVPSRWFNLSPPPTAREGMAVTSFENELYVIGGRDHSGVTSVIEKYSPETESWTSLVSKPISAADIGASPLAGGIYVPGGITSDGTPTDIVEMYDPREDVWVQKASLPVELSAYAIVAFEGHLYLFGGWDGKQYVNSVYMYIPDVNRWEERSPMPTLRGHSSAIVAGGKIYVIGGTNGDDYLDVNEIYQPDLEVGLTVPWSEGEQLPFGKAKMGIANIADTIYLVGGEGSNENISVLTYDPREEVWGQIEAPLPNNWHSLGASPVGTRLFALGGLTDQGILDDMWEFQAIFTISLPIVR